MANIKISELNPLVTIQDADVLPIVDNAVTKKVTAAILRSYTEGNSVLLTGAQTVAGIKTFTSQLASSVATGTAPFSVASTTKVTNLNADLLDGLSSADFALSTRTLTAGTGLTGGGDLTANRTFAIDSTVATLTGTQTLTNKTITSPVINEILDSNGNEILGFTPIASATDYITIKNGIGVGVPLHISAAGSSTNTGLHLEPKGSGLVQISDGTDTSKGFRFRSSGSAASAVTLLDAVSSAGRVITLPDATTTLVGTNTTDTLTNKSISGATNTLSNIGNASLTNSAITINGTSTSLGGSINVGTVTSVAALTLGTSGTDLTSSVATGTTTPVITLNVPTASASNRGALSSTDWSTFNAKQNAITLTTTGTSGAATLVGSTLNIPNYADTDTGITSLNGLTALTQTFAVGTSGTDFGISSATSTHTFNLPTASASNRGALSSADWTTFNNKQNALTNPITGTGTTNYLPKFTGASALGNSLFQEGTSAIGLGVTPITWNAVFKALQIGTKTAIWDTSGATQLSYNAYNDGANKYLTTGVAMRYFMTDAGHTWSTAPSGTAGGALTFTAAMTLDTSGQLLIGTTTSSTFKLDVVGTARVSSDATINGVTVGRGAGNIATNTAVGFEAINSNVSGTDVTAIGYRALKASTGVSNTAVGSNALTANTTGANNTALGKSALSATTTGSTNTAIGENALFTNVGGSFNTAIGSAALFANVSGINNVAIGRVALQNNTASNNVAIGFEAANANTSGQYITAIGYQALRASTGDQNTAVGWQSLLVNTTGAKNTAVGQGSLYSNTTGANNTALGVNALGLNTASNNTAVGFEAAFSNTSATGNTILGYQAARANSTGANNSIIGFGQVCTNFSGVSMIGVSDTATAANQMRFGSSTVNNGAVATEVVVSDRTWAVFINGVAYKILLKA